MTDYITIKGARLHNLKNIDVSIPKNRLIVFTGLSGSGKSSLAFDTLHREGQRQYMESLGFATDNIKPQVDSITGLSPSISIDQHAVNRNIRSTVGTSSDIYTYLRVIFARIGHRPCPSCGKNIPPSQEIGEDVWEEAADAPEEEPEASGTGNTYPCPHCGNQVPEMGMANFSFNKPEGMCPSCTGLGTTLNIDMLINQDLSIEKGAVLQWKNIAIIRHYARVLKAAGNYYGFQFSTAVPFKELGRVQKDYLLYGVESPRFIRHFPDARVAATSLRQGKFEGIVTGFMRRFAERLDDGAYREKREQYLQQKLCPDCNGTRLNRQSLAVAVAGKNIAEISALPVDGLNDWLTRLKKKLPKDEWSVAESILANITGRVQRIVDVGLGYLTMERSSPTLSGGEAQRLRLASLLGSGLTGVLYVFDEPTIGLHPRDTNRLIGTLFKLRDLKNTVIVVEHDPDMLRAADYIVDIGPGAGKDGGRLVAAGAPEEIAGSKNSVTGDYLSGRLAVKFPQMRLKGNGKRLIIRGARANNLKNITAEIPLGVFIAVTGVSGSGKSSLMIDILDRAAGKHFSGRTDVPGDHEAIEGWENINKVISIDQSAISRTPRSNAATYTDTFSAIRKVYASTKEAIKAGFTSGHFSFNIPGGRCERCGGAGVLPVEMHFLPGVEVRCPLCRGRRFKKEILEIKYNGYNISRILDLTIDEALPVFKDEKSVAGRLSLLTDVGLGYLKLGQPATTLSGGEAQRVKLSKELSRRSSGKTLYLLDEPTTGLHPADIIRLLDVLRRLVTAGNTVIVIEHNMDVIKTADWIIDLGPEGGNAGGCIIAEGPPEKVAKVKESLTGQSLAKAGIK